jgi:hypothetical protein
MSEAHAPTSAARVQATTVRMRDAFVEKTYGVPARQRFRQAVSAPLRDLLASKTDPPGGWVPFDFFVEATVVADRLYGKSDLALAWEMGRFGATHNIGVWKSLFMRHVTPARVMSIASGLWSHHYDGGRTATRALGPTSMSFSIVDFPQPHKAHCNSIGGWIMGTLELGPRKSVVVKEVACRTEGAGFCEFRISWEA